MENFIEKSNPIAQEFPPLSNTYVVYVDGTELLKNVQLDIAIQRELDLDWVEELKTKIIQDHNEKGYFFFGTFEVASFNNALYLLNGQHRYFVLKDILNLFDKVSIPVNVNIYTVSSQHELNELWMKVNGSKPSRLCKSTSKQIILNSIKKYLNQNYPNYITTAVKPQKPNINLEFLGEAIEKSNILEELNIESSEEFIRLMEQINTFYKYVDAGKWREWHINDESLIMKCKIKNVLKPLFLGIFSNYEWLTRMLEVNKKNTHYHSYSCIPHIPINVACRKIGKSKRRKVWEKRNCKDSMIGKCFVCDKTIDYDEFECGHITSAFWGGSQTLQNLEPICGSCNKDMGVENLNEYKRKFYQMS